MPAECARWQRFCGVCLLGVDEMQFMTQSENSSVLVTRTMLAIAEIQLPWFVIANYSLGWKLMSRPAEATQRLLGNPTLLLPDPPNSNDWKLLLKEYQVVAADAFAFKLLDHANDLWNLSAGLKRELVKLLVLSYRISRRCGEKQVIWPHVVSAFSSVEFSVSRRDINLLVAHAAQGGDLRKDLNCPFSGTDIQSQRQAYEEELRKARAAVVANEVIKSAMTMSEKKAIEGIASQSSPTGSVQTNHSRKRSRRTLEDLQTAGRKANERRKSLKTDDIIRPSS
jgi:hypothetical protein